MYSNDTLWKNTTYHFSIHEWPTTDTVVDTITSNALTNKLYTTSNVGIGTTSPSTLLEIKGNGDANNNQIIIQNESYDKGILFKYKSATGTSYDFNQARIWTSQHGAYDTKLHFSTAKNVPPSTTPPLNR